MSGIFARLREELGALGLAALAVLAIALVFFLVAVKPLEESLVRIDRELRDAARRGAPGYVKTANARDPASKLVDFYALFKSEEGKAVWLARINGIATASGLELRSAEYRLADSAGRIERYEITLPVVGTYAQVWTFLESALVEIPTLSLDRVSLRRKSVGEPRAEAEVSLTLHLLKR